MALRDQPYIPLYVQDFITDEKLAECSAEATGVYIRIMCLMHKSEEYGTILLKQKSKQTDKQIYNFALQIAKHLPYSVGTIERSITELIEEGVLKLEGDLLIQKRMVKDNYVSEQRKIAGGKGGKKTQETVKNFAKAKVKANTENEIIIENKNEITVNTNINSKFEKMLLESESVLGTVCFQLKIGTNEAVKLRTMFVEQMAATAEHHNNYTDYSKHFVNWAKLNKDLLKGEQKGKLASHLDSHQEALLILQKERDGE